MMAAVTSMLALGLSAAPLAIRAEEAAADKVPTLREVYAASESGHLVEAQEMMAKVLKAHPDSARAHYVEAVLDSRQGNLVAGRSELAQADHLQPGLPFATPDAVANLRKQLQEPSKAVK